MKAKVDDIYLNYELAGIGEYFTFIHGLATDLTVWQAQTMAFCHCYHVLAFDTRGFGRSDKPQGPYSVQMFSDDMYGLLYALDIKSSIIAGHSMGGRIAMTFTLNHPEMVRALILVDTSAAVSLDMQAIFEQHAELAESRGMGKAIDAMATRIFSVDFARYHPESFAHYCTLLMRNDPVAYAAACRAIAQFDLTTELGCVTCPTLIIVGDQDIVTPLHAARVLNQLIPTSRLTVIKDSGHSPMVEQPEEFNTAIRLFLKTIES